MNDPKQDSMLRVRDVAKRLDVSERTVFRWLKEGNLMGHRLGRNLRISEADLEDFLVASKARAR